MTLLVVCSLSLSVWSLMTSLKVKLLSDCDGGRRRHDGACGCFRRLASTPPLSAPHRASSLMLSWWFAPQRSWKPCCQSLRPNDLCFPSGGKLGGFLSPAFQPVPFRAHPSFPDFLFLTGHSIQLWSLSLIFILHGSSVSGFSLPSPPPIKALLVSGLFPKDKIAFYSCGLSLSPFVRVCHREKFSLFLMFISV